jgi:hypothetical protein
VSCFLAHLQKSSGKFLAKGCGAQVWNLQSNLIDPSEDQVSFYSDLVSEVNAKAGIGFRVQIVRQEHILQTMQLASSWLTLAVLDLRPTIGGSRWETISYPRSIG